MKKLSPVDRDRLAWQPGDISFGEDASAKPEVEKNVSVTAGVFSDLVTEKARIDEARGWRLAADIAKVGPHGYSHGWIKDGPDEAAITGMTADDTAAVASHRADEAATAARAQPAEPGSHAHAEELRQLGNEADLHTAQSFTSLHTSKSLA